LIIQNHFFDPLLCRTAQLILRIILPPRREANHPRRKLRPERICSSASHGLIHDTLKFFEIISFVHELSVFEAETAVAIVLTCAGALLKGIKQLSQAFFMEMKYKLFERASQAERSLFISHTDTSHRSRSRHARGTSP